MPNYLHYLLTALFCWIRLMGRYAVSLLSFGFRAKFRTIFILFLAILLVLFLTNALFSIFQSNTEELAVHADPNTPAKKYNTRCTMDRCFDSSRCKEFKVCLLYLSMVNRLFIF